MRRACRVAAAAAAFLRGVRGHTCSDGGRRRRRRPCSGGSVRRRAAITYGNRVTRSLFDRFVRFCRLVSVVGRQRVAGTTGLQQHAARHHHRAVATAEERLWRQDRHRDGRSDSGRGCSGNRRRRRRRRRPSGSTKVRRRLRHRPFGGRLRPRHRHATRAPAGTRRKRRDRVCGGDRWPQVTVAAVRGQRPSAGR